MIRAILFDLGNVLLNFDHGIITRRMAMAAGIAESPRASFARLTESFEIGELTASDFFAGVERNYELSGRVDLPAFTEMWSDIFWENQELTALLPVLARKVRLVLLSNTNALHIEHARRNFPHVFAPFHDCVFSCEIGLRKPDPRIFAEALNRAGVEAENALYFDDIRHYVDAASRLGLHAYQVVSASCVKDILRAYELL